MISTYTLAYVVRVRSLRLYPPRILMCVRPLTTCCASRAIFRCAQVGPNPSTQPTGAPTEAVRRSLLWLFPSGTLFLTHCFSLPTRTALPLRMSRFWCTRRRRSTSLLLTWCVHDWTRERGRGGQVCFSSQNATHNSNCPVWGRLYHTQDLSNFLVCASAGEFHALCTWKCGAFFRTSSPVSPWISIAIL